MRLAPYRGKHRSRVTLVDLVHKRRQEWPVLVRHAAMTPNMQQVPFDWSATVPEYIAGDRVWYTFDGNQADTGTVLAVKSGQVFVTWDDGRYDTPEVVDSVKGEWFNNSEIALVES